MTVAIAPPPAETEAAILRLVVRTYPRSGNQLEAAVRMATRLTWAAARGIDPEHLTTEKASRT